MATKKPHEELLEQEARTAPEPETAEERSRRLGLKTGGGAIVGGTAAAAKLGVLSKGLLWFFVFRGAIDAWRIGSWIGIALVLFLLAALLIRRLRKESS